MLVRPQLGDAGVTVTEMEGAESQMKSSRGSSDCEGFASTFGFFSCSVLTPGLFGSLLGQPGMVPGQEQGHPKMPCSQCQAVPLALTTELHPPSPSSCICSGLVTPLVFAVTPQGAVQNQPLPPPLMHLLGNGG